MLRVEVCASQALLFVVAVAFGRCDVAVFDVVVVVGHGWRLSRLVVSLDRGLVGSGIRVFRLAAAIHGFRSFVRTGGLIALAPGQGIMRSGHNLTSISLPLTGIIARAAQSAVPFFIEMCKGRPSLM